MDFGLLRETWVKIDKDRNDKKALYALGKSRMHSVSGRHHDDR